MRQIDVSVGFAASLMRNNVISPAEFEEWIAKEIDRMEEPPSYLYELLNYENHQHGILGIFDFNMPPDGLFEGEWQYLVQIAARRGHPPHEDIAYALDYDLNHNRKSEINERIYRMLNFKVDELPKK